MKKLESYKVKEISLKEMNKINGGIPWPVIISAAALVGAGMEWAFEKGEELGKALA
ncbi:MULTISPECIES: bacteriocin [Tenacibaculum]|uniref:bacteriocin n=1 Tax=Tenacibaculum TaxID=104267 RepID=UPI001430EC02|nr:bacteriocin [Tenacibaculum mesophilum]KAF9659148.1 bacteriocin [Tenacibaculum mesophilum]